MNIKAKSTFDRKTITAFTRAMLFRKSDPFRKMLVYCLTFVLLSAVVAAEMYLLGPSVPMYILLGVCVFALLLELYLYFIVPRIRCRALADRNVNEFLFADDGFEVCGQWNDYSVLTGAMETSEYLYIFQNRSQALIVEKATVTGGTAAQLQKKLQSVLKKHYMICKY